MSITFIWIHCLNISNYKTGCNILFELIAVFYSYEQSYNNTRKIFCLFFFPFFGGGGVFLCYSFNKSQLHWIFKGDSILWHDQIHWTCHNVFFSYLLFKACVKSVLTFANAGRDLLVSPPSAENALLNSGGSYISTSPNALYRIKDQDAKIFTVKITVKNVKSFTVDIWSGETIVNTLTKVWT